MSDDNGVNGTDDETENITPEIVEEGRRGACPWKALKGRDDLMSAVASTAIMAGVIAISCYGQYLLTKWACKAAIRETRR
ncbi:hypothetical protein KIH77_05800 [Bifidobacterium sp. 82T24]|uniref:hypothetical protein n=1 Tax=Bifidobacterium pluvialisilvae TaxID=2834436 RepID=UPI001C587E53|nr:hypothetical protein [Bifidobacterium pluvialisilvae]MBW3088244.1 hypothetical protein [Bifidobacterium pluvialisilvae]